MLRPGYGRENAVLPYPGLAVVSQMGRAFLMDAEGVDLVAYQDGGGVWTIGVGSLVMSNGRKVQPGDTITYVDAIGLLDSTLRRFEIAVGQLLLGVKGLSQCEFDAMVLLAYNIGYRKGGFASSALLRAFLNKKKNSTPVRLNTLFDLFSRWHYDNGKPVWGLARRRLAEASICWFGRYTKVSEWSKAETLAAMARTAFPTADIVYAKPELTL